MMALNLTGGEEISGGRSPGSSPGKFPCFSVKQQQNCSKLIALWGGNVNWKCMSDVFEYVKQLHRSCTSS